MQGPVKIKKTKFFCTRYPFLNEVEEALGPEWFVCHWGQALTGRRFDIMIFTDQPQDDLEQNWFNHIKCRLKPKAKTLVLEE